MAILARHTLRHAGGRAGRSLRGVQAPVTDMPTLSLLINVISLSVAAVMTAIVVRMRREERARSDARAAALAAMAHADFLSEPEPFAHETDALLDTTDSLSSAPNRVSPRPTRLIAAAAGIVL